MKFTSRFARIVGVTSLAALLVAGLAACGVPGAKANQDYLVLAKVKAVNCATVPHRSTVANEMQATANFVAKASSKQTNDILALNPGLTSLTPLSTELTTQVKNCGGATDAQLASDTTTTPSPELKALLDAANAPLKEFSCVNIVTSTGGKVIDGAYALFVNTILKVDKGNPDLRQWSDALSTPLKGATAAEMRTWINRAICEEPVIGVSLAHLFAHLQVGGVTVLSLQSTDWLKPFAVDASQINDLVASYTPLTVWHLKNPSKQDSPDDVWQAALKANAAYQEVASRLVFLLSRYQLGQVMNINSTHHYHLVGGGLTADNIPEVEISTVPDTLPSLVFFLTEKTACVPISVLAFNTGDKRPMLGDIPQSCAPLLPPPPPAPVAPVTPQTPTGGGGGGTPGCTHDCGGTPPCVADCAKIWSQSVPHPDGVTRQGNDAPEVPQTVHTPAPVQHGGDSSTGSGTPAQGSSSGAGNAPAPPAGTGTTSGGGTGSVNPSPAPGSTAPPVNSGDPGNPFGG